MEKLWQVRLKVPPLDEQEFRKVLVSASRDEQNRGDNGLREKVSQVPKVLGRLLSTALIALIVGGVVFGSFRLGNLFNSPAKNSRSDSEIAPHWLSDIQLAGKLNNADVTLRVEPKSEAKAIVSVTPSPSGSPSSNSSGLGAISSTLSPTSSVAESGGVVLPGERVRPSWGWIALAGLIAFAGTLQILAIREKPIIQDSPIFMQTLDRFVPCIRAACKTPRSIKLLINRVRLYAMMLRHWMQVEDEVSETRRGIDWSTELEKQLVIFGVLEKLCPHQLQQVLWHVPGSSFKLENIQEELSDFDSECNEAISKLISQKFWSRFAQLLDAVESGNGDRGL